MEGIRYSFSKSKTDFSTSGSNYIGYVALNSDGVGYTENGSRGVCDEHTLNVILNYTPMLVIAGVASTPLASKLYSKVAGTRYIWIAETLFCAAVLMLCTASLVRQEYSPFIYFRF